MMSFHHAAPTRSRGFDEARYLLWCYECRVRTYQQITATAFQGNMAVAAIHVQNTARTDRATLTTFDASGRRLGGDTVYIDNPSQRIDLAPEFDHDFTKMQIPIDSELERAVACEDGWVINMRALRSYEPASDRQATQRAVFLAHLGDMIDSGEARGFLLGGR